MLSFSLTDTGSPAIPRGPSGAGNEQLDRTSGSWAFRSEKRRKHMTGQSGTAGHDRVCRIGHRVSPSQPVSLVSASQPSKQVPPSQGSTSQCLPQRNQECQHRKLCIRGRGPFNLRQFRGARLVLLSGSSCSCVACCVGPHVWAGLTQAASSTRLPRFLPLASPAPPPPPTRCASGCPGRPRVACRSKLSTTSPTLPTKTREHQLPVHHQDAHVLRTLCG